MGRKVISVSKILTNPEDTDSSPLTWDRLVTWLAGTGWVDGYVRRTISDLDKQYVDDYIQEVWEQILLIDHDKLLEVWYHGKGRFVNYIKRIVKLQIYSKNSRLYYHIRKARKKEYYLDDVGWNNLAESGESAVHDVYRWSPGGYDKYVHDYKNIRVGSDLYE